MNVNLRSFERGFQAIEFFDRYIPRTAAQLTHITICKKLFSFEEVFAMKSLERYFEQTKTFVRDPEKLTQKLIDLAGRNRDSQNQAGTAEEFIKELNNEPIHELERLPALFYEDGIDPLKSKLTISQMVAYQHWQGNSNYTATDAIRAGLSDNPP